MATVTSSPTAAPGTTVRTCCAAAGGLLAHVQGRRHLGQSCDTFPRVSSATRVDVGKARSYVNGLPSPVPDGDGQQGPTDQLTPRQKELERLWSYYRCSNYDGRGVDWNGGQVMDHQERDNVSRSGFIPPGFYDVGQTLPLTCRRPIAPYYLGRIVPTKFTNLLFGAKRHPKLTSDDPRTEDWLAGVAEVTRLWSKAAQLRNYGGAMGSGAIGYKFSHGKPVVEVHDPRWCFPEFEDRSTFELKRLEKRYQYPVQVRKPDGSVEEEWRWYRRVIDDQTDSVWKDIPVEGSDEPPWDSLQHQQVQHGFGECPVVWVQNIPVEDDIDGDPDCHGIYDLIEDIDALWSQASKGTKANCDPTVAITSDAEFDQIQKGSGMAIQVEKGGSVQYLEMTGAGTKAAMELAEKLEEKALTIACVTLDRNEGGPSRTASEVEHNYSSMLEQAGLLREQYGQAIKRLMEMILKSARRLTQQRVDRTGPVARIVQNTIKLPKRRIVNPDGTAVWVDRMLGNGEQIDLQWPEFYEPSPSEIGARVDAAGKAKTYGIIDVKHAVDFIARDFNIENPAQTVEAIKAEAPAGPPGAPGAAGGALQRVMSGAKSPIPDPGRSSLLKKFGAPGV